MFSKAELALIKDVFADRDDLIYTIRKLFLQFELTEEEKASIRRLSPETKRVLRKRILPEYSDEYPLTQIADLFFTLTDDMKRLSVDDMAPLFLAKDLEQDFLLQQFDVLENIDTADQPLQLRRMRVLKDKDPFTQMIDLTAYNYLLAYIDQMLGHIKLLAGAKEETPEEQEKRLTRDSTK